MLRKNDLKNGITGSLTHSVGSCSDFRLLPRGEGTCGHRKEGTDASLALVAGPACGAAASASEQQPNEFKLSCLLGTA